MTPKLWILGVTGPWEMDRANIASYSFFLFLTKASNTQLMCHLDYLDEMLLSTQVCEDDITALRCLASFFSAILSKKKLAIKNLVRGISSYISVKLFFTCPMSHVVQNMHEGVYILYRLDGSWIRSQIVSTNSCRKPFVDDHIVFAHRNHTGSTLLMTTLSLPTEIMTLNWSSIQFVRHLKHPPSKARPSFNSILCINIDGTVLLWAAVLFNEESLAFKRHGKSCLLLWTSSIATMVDYFTYMPRKKLKYLIRKNALLFPETFRSYFIKDKQRDQSTFWLAFLGKEPKLE